MKPKLDRKLKQVVGAVVKTWRIASDLTEAQMSREMGNEFSPAEIVRLEAGDPSRKSKAYLTFVEAAGEVYGRKLPKRVDEWEASLLTAVGAHQAYRQLDSRPR